MITKVLSLVVGLATSGLLSLPISPSHEPILPVVAADEKNPNANSDPIYSQLRSVGLSGEYCGIENLTLRKDVGTITFKQGQLHFLSPVEGRITGAVFLGEGEFQMTPAVALEQRFLSILTDATSITEKFSKMVLRFTDDTYEQIKKEGRIKTGSPDASAKSALEDNRRMLRKGKTYTSFSAALAFVQYNLDERILIDLTWPGQGGLFMAYFDGKRFGDMLFGIDPLGAPVVSPEEVVLACLGNDSSGIWVAEHLSQHYQTAAVFAEEHQLFDIEHQKIEATLRGKRLDAVVQTKLKSRVDGIRVLPFDLLSRLRMKKVTDGAGRDLKFIQENRNDDADFAVILAEGLKKDEPCTLTFEYGGDDAIDDSGGGNFTLVARTNWYPNSYVGDRATYEMTLKCPKGLTMVATGQPLGQSDEGDYNVSRWKSDIPLGVAGFNYGKFKTAVVDDERLKYKIETYANKDIPDYLKDIQRSIEQAESAGVRVEATLGSLNTVALLDKARLEAQASMQLYSDMFGPLPYGRIAMTQQPYFNFGQAWPMLVYMPLMAYLDSTYRHQLGLDRARNFVLYVAAHEVAHQWWGHILGWKSYRDQWMSEGFSEFSASIFAQTIYKQDKFVEFWREQRELITTKNTLGKRPVDVGSVYMGYRLDTPKTGSVTRAMIYPKGAFILHMLRMLMWDSKTGDQRFSEMMKDFVKTHFNRNVSTQDFQSIVEKHMTKEMDLDRNGKMLWFFADWVYGTNIPGYKLEYRLDPAEGEQVKLVARITQSNVDDTFKMRIPIYVDMGAGPRRLGTVALFGNTTTDELQVMLPKRPKKVSLCTFEDVLCTTDNR